MHIIFALLSFSEKSILKIISVLAACTLLPYIALSYFVFPIADDLSYAQQGMDSVWMHYKINYLNWCGRYVSNFMVLLNGFITPDIILYRLYPFLLIVLTLLSVYIVVKKIIKLKSFSFPVFLFSTLFVSLYLNMMPNLAEGVYWYTGSVTYVFPAFILLFYALLMYLYIKGKLIFNKWLHAVIQLVLLFLLMGFNEALMLLLFCMHVFLFLFLKINNSDKSVGVLMFAFLSFLFAFIVILAPGNENRSDFFPDKHQLIRSFIYSDAQTVRFFVKWILSLPLLLFSLLYIPYAKELNAKMEIKKYTNVSPLIVIFCLLIVIYCAVFPPYWATGMLGQYRTLNTVLIVFLLFWFAGLHYASEKYVNDNLNSVLAKKSTQLVLSVFLVLSLLFTGNGSVAMYDLFSGKAHRFKIQQELRNQTFVEAKKNNNDDVRVNLLQDKPESIFVLDITNDSTHWINYSYASYYGLKSAKAE